MKRKCFFVVLVCMLLTSGCVNNEIKIEIEPYESDKIIIPAEPMNACYADKYKMNLHLDDKQNVLQGDVEMHIINESETILDTIVIRNDAASILKTKQKGNSIVEDMELIDNHESLTMKVKEDPSIIYVDLHESLLPGKSISIGFHFKTDIPKQKDRFGYAKYKNKSIYQLSFCFPRLSIYQNGKWNENPVLDKFESNYNRIADYDIQIETPKGYTVVASGEENKKGNITQIKAENVREMAMVISNYMKVDTQMVKNVRINQVSLQYDGMEEFNEISMQTAMDAVILYTELFGNYPYEELDVVQSFIPLGMEFPGLVMIALEDHGTIKEVSTNPSSNLCFIIAHEIAHQWFYGAVGNDPYSEPWLDEGFASFCEEVLYRQSKAPSLMEVCKDEDDGVIMTDETFKKFQKQVIPTKKELKIPINASFDAYDQDVYGTKYDYDKEYTRCVYSRGSAFLYELEQAMGEGAFFHMMQEYYRAYQFREVSGVEFLAAVRTFDDSKEVNAVIEKYIDETRYQ